jgi:hypothetical protein
MAKTKHVLFHDFLAFFAAFAGKSVEISTESSGNGYLSARGDGLRARAGIAA